MQRGKTLKSQGREIVANVITCMEDEKRKQSPNLSFNNVFGRVADATGLSMSTVKRIKKQSIEGDFSTPGKKRPRTAAKRELDEFDRSVIRRTIHDMYTNKNIPTLSSLRKKLSDDKDIDVGRTTLHKILGDLGFKWKRWNGRKFLMERPEIVAKRREFLKEMKRNSELTNPRPVIYQDETWIHSSHCTPKGWQEFSSNQTTSLSLKVPASKGTRFIICHAGSKDGFVEEASLFFRSRKSTGDYHGEMNAETFTKWFQEQLLVNLPANSIIVLDNAPYHSMLIERAPTSSWRKQQIVEYLEKHHISFESEMLKAELLQLARKSKQPKRYVIDEIAEEHGHRVLRLPPYHCDLNPIELIWADAKGYVSRNNAIFSNEGIEKLWKEAITRITAAKWSSCVEHVKKIENDYWTSDSIIDEVLDSPVESLIIRIGGSSDSESTDDESTDEYEIEGIHPLDSD